MRIGKSSLIGGFLIIVLIIPVFTIMRINASRLSNRLQELGIRRSFGARRHHILMQFLLENLMITFLGGLLGLVLSGITFNFLLSIAYPDQESIGLVLNGTSLGWTMSIVILFSLFTGFLPAYKASRFDPIFALSDGKNKRFFSSKYNYDKISGFAVGGIFLALTLALSVPSKGIISTYKMHWVSKLNAHTIGINLLEGASIDGKHAMIKRKLKNIEGIKHMTFTDASPLAGSSRNTFNTPNGQIHPHFFYVDESYHNIIKFQMLQGQWFGEDNKLFNPNRKNVIISDAAAQLFFDSMDCLGKTIRDKENITYHIVGICKAKPLTIERKLDRMQIFLFDQTPEKLSLLIQLDEGKDIKTVWAAIEERLDQIPGVYIRSCDGRTDEYLSEYQDYMPTFKGLSIVLFIVLTKAVVGFFAIGWSQVRKRKQEIGVRRASGARKLNIYHMFIGEHLKTGLIAIGICLIPISQIIVFFGNKIFAREYWIYATMASCFITIGSILISAYFPARRAAATDPVVALSED